MEVGFVGVAVPMVGGMTVLVIMCVTMIGMIVRALVGVGMIVLIRSLLIVLWMIVVVSLIVFVFFRHFSILVFTLSISASSVPPW